MQLPPWPDGLLKPITLVRLGGVAGGVATGAMVSSRISDAARDADSPTASKVAFGAHAALAAGTYVATDHISKAKMPGAALHGLVTGTSLMLTLGTVLSGYDLLARSSD